MKNKVTFGIISLGNMPAAETAEFASKAENYGLDYFWVADENPAYPFRDVMVNLAAAALKTQRIKLGSNICPVYTRHPALLAVAMQSLSEMSNGRAILGIGPGGSMTLPALGIPTWKHPLRAMREATDILRRLFAGEEVTFESDIFKVDRVKLFSSGHAPVPIYYGVRGPKMLELAAELADGLLIQTSPSYFAFELECINRGLAKAHRARERLDIGSLGPFAVDNDGEYARELVKPALTYQVPDSPMVMREKIGVSEEETRRLRETRLNQGAEAAIKLITKRMIDEMTVAGTPEQVTEKILFKIKMGANQFIFSPPQGRTRMDGLKLIGEEVIPRVRKTLA
jgi:5,10-methylenetetrahydromethanopterin reductase